MANSILELADADLAASQSAATPQKPAGSVLDLLPEMEEKEKLAADVLGSFDPDDPISDPYHFPDHIVAQHTKTLTEHGGGDDAGLQSQTDRVLAAADIKKAQQPGLANHLADNPEYDPVGSVAFHRQILDGKLDGSERAGELWRALSERGVDPRQYAAAEIRKAEDVHALRAKKFGNRLWRGKGQGVLKTAGHSVAEMGKELFGAAPIAQSAAYTVDDAGTILNPLSDDEKSDYAKESGAAAFLDTGSSLRGMGNRIGDWWKGHVSGSGGDAARDPKELKEMLWRDAGEQEMKAGWQPSEAHLKALIEKGKAPTDWARPLRWTDTAEEQELDALEKVNGPSEEQKARAQELKDIIASPEYAARQRKEMQSHGAEQVALMAGLGAASKVVQPVAGAANMAVGGTGRLLFGAGEKLAGTQAAKVAGGIGAGVKAMAHDPVMAVASAATPYVAKGASSIFRRASEGMWNAGKEQLFNQGRPLVARGYVARISNDTYKHLSTAGLVALPLSVNEDPEEALGSWIGITSLSLARLFPGAGLALSPDAFLHGKKSAMSAARGTLLNEAMSKDLLKSGMNSALRDQGKKLGAEYLKDDAAAMKAERGLSRAAREQINLMRGITGDVGTTIKTYTGEGYVAALRKAMEADGVDARQIDADMADTAFKHSRGYANNAGDQIILNAGRNSFDGAEVLSALRAKLDAHESAIRESDSLRDQLYKMQGVGGDKTRMAELRQRLADSDARIMDDAPREDATQKLRMLERDRDAAKTGTRGGAAAFAAPHEVGHGYAEVFSKWFAKHSHDALAVALTDAASNPKGLDAIYGIAREIGYKGLDPQEPGGEETAKREAVAEIAGQLLREGGPARFLTGKTGDDIVRDFVSRLPWLRWTVKGSAEYRMQDVPRLRAAVEDMMRETMPEIVGHGEAKRELAALRAKSEKAEKDAKAPDLSPAERRREAVLEKKIAETESKIGRDAPEPDPEPAADTPADAPQPAAPDPVAQHRADAAKVLVKLGLDPTEADYWAGEADGTDLSSLVRDAQKRRNEQLKPKPPTPAAATPPTPAATVPPQPAAPAGALSAVEAPPQPPARGGALAGGVRAGAAEPTPERIAAEPERAEADAVVAAKVVALPKEQRIPALLDILTEAAGEDKSLLQRRVDEHGKVSHTGRINLDLPEHRVFLDELGLAPEQVDKIKQAQAAGGEAKFVDYWSASNLDPTDITGKQRQKEYAADKEKRSRSLLQTNKQIIFTGVTAWPGGAIVQKGISVDKFVGNVAKLLKAAKEAGLPVDYADINDRNIYKDLQGYIGNHANRVKGDGSGPVSGETPTEGYQPYLIPRARFDLLNAAFHIETATATARLADRTVAHSLKLEEHAAKLAAWEQGGQKGKKPRKPPAPRIAEETKLDEKAAQDFARENQWQVDDATGDVNPFRALLNREGKLTHTNEQTGETRKGTTEVLETVFENLSPDMIKEIRDTPDGEPDIVRDVGYKGGGKPLAKGLPNWRNVASGFMPDSAEQTPPGKKKEGALAKGIVPNDPKKRPAFMPDAPLEDFTPPYTKETKNPLLKETWRDVTAAKSGGGSVVGARGYFIMPDGRLFDATSEFDGSSGLGGGVDHYGFGTAHENADVFYIPKRLRKANESGEEEPGGDAFTDTWRYINGQTQARVFSSPKSARSGNPFVSVEFRNPGTTLRDALRKAQGWVGKQLPDAPENTEITLEVTTPQVDGYMSAKTIQEFLAASNPRDLMGRFMPDSGAAPFEARAFRDEWNGGWSVRVGPGENEILWLGTLRKADAVARAAIINERRARETKGGGALAGGVAAQEKKRGALEPPPEKIRVKTDASDTFELIGGYKDPVFDIPKEAQDRIRNAAERSLNRIYPEDQRESEDYRNDFMEYVQEHSEEWARNNPRRADPEVAVSEMTHAETEARLQELRRVVGGREITEEQLREVYLLNKRQSELARRARTENQPDFRNAGKVAAEFAARTDPPASRDYGVGRGTGESWIVTDPTGDARSHHETEQSARIEATRLNASSTPAAAPPRRQSSMPTLYSQHQAIHENHPLAEAAGKADGRLESQQSEMVKEIESLTEKIDDLREHQRSAGLEEREELGRLREYRSSLVEDHVETNRLRQSLRQLNPTRLNQYPNAYAELRRLEMRGIVTPKEAATARQRISDAHDALIASEFLRNSEEIPAAQRRARIEEKVEIARRQRDEEERKGTEMWRELLNARNDEAIPRIAELWKQVSENDDAYAYGRTAAKEPGAIAKELSTPGHEITATQTANIITFRSANGSLAIENPNGRRPTIGASNANSAHKKQGGGAQLYQAALAWAHNNGKTIHPSNALSAINAYVRRTSTMLSSALRFGTTRHMIPDRDQGVRNWIDSNDLQADKVITKHALEFKEDAPGAEKGDLYGIEGDPENPHLFNTPEEAAEFAREEFGERWQEVLKQIRHSREADTTAQEIADANNIAQLAIRESEQVMRAVPELQSLAFDFESGKVKDANGNEVKPKQIQDILERDRDASYSEGVGLSTAQRGIITASAIGDPTRTLAGPDAGRGVRIVKEQKSILYMPDSDTPALYGQHIDRSEGKAPRFNWNEPDLQINDTWSKEGVRKWLKRPKDAAIYKSMIDLSNLNPKLAEREDGEDGGGYDWSELQSRRGSGPPPIVVTRKADGTIEIEDGNHRAEFWQNSGYEIAPAWVNDELVTEHARKETKAGKEVRIESKFMPDSDSKKGVVIRQIWGDIRGHETDNDKGRTGALAGGLSKAADGGEKPTGARASGRATTRELEDAITRDAHPDETFDDRWERENAALRKWAEGRTVDKLPPEWDAADPKLNKGGMEHDVFYDKASNRWVKVADGRLGFFPAADRLPGWSMRNFATPGEYLLQRLKNQEKLFGVETEVHGAYRDEQGRLGLITSQPHIEGRALEVDEIAQLLAKDGFVPIDHNVYYRASDNTLIADANDANVVEVNGKAVSYDVNVMHPEGKLREEIEKSLKSISSPRPKFMPDSPSAPVPDADRPGALSFGIRERRKEQKSALAGGIVSNDPKRTKTAFMPDAPRELSEQEIRPAVPMIVEAAQRVYDEWKQDKDGLDEELGSGGICDRIADEIAGIMSERGWHVSTGGQEGDDHAFVVATDGRKAYAVDIPPGVYESGSGYNWKKRDGVKISKEHVEIYEVPLEAVEEDVLAEAQREAKETGKK